MDDQTVWFTKQKKVCDQLQDPALHRRIKKCLEERNKDPNLLSREPDYGLMMLHILCPHSFNNELKGYDGSRCIPFRTHFSIGSFNLSSLTHFSIGSLNLSSWTNSCHGRSGAGIVEANDRPDHVINETGNETGIDIGGRLIYCQKIRRPGFVHQKSCRLIRAINEMTGGYIGIRRVKGLDNKTIQKLYHIFMHLPEFEEE